MPNVIMPFGDKPFPQNILDTFNSYGLHPISVKIDELLNESGEKIPGDLIFFDFTRFSSQNGFVTAISEIFPTLPIVVSHIEDELSPNYLAELANVIDFVEQPVAVSDICSRLIIDWNSYTTVLGRVKVSTSGFLNEQNLIDIMNIFSTGKLSGLARLNSNNRQGVVWFKKGELIDVQFKDFEPLQALNKLILWDNGTFSMEFTEVEREKRIELPGKKIIEEGKERIRKYFIKKDALPGDNTRLYAITEYDEDDFSEEEREILKYFKMGKTLGSFIAVCSMDELKALDLLSELMVKKAILLSDLERDEMDEKNRGLGGIINRISSFFKKEENEVEDDEKDSPETDVQDSDPGEYQLRFAKAQLDELVSLVKEKI